ncbi:MAG: hypothetical protein HY291_22425 [Planctomycetes bacterium]|nr:hypothetical protein [Planctomycetota bacterium]
MDLLIHLVIWIFRTLFGEQEPPAQLGPRNRTSDSEPSRGPYDYGDGRGQRSGQKTLAELLEEARRQAEGGRPRQVSPPPQPAPQRSAPQVVQQAAAPAKKAKKRKADAPPQPVQTGTIAANAAAANRGIGLHQGPQSERAKQLLPLFAALKGGGRTRHAQQLLAAQAFVLKEVFDAPRSRRPFGSHRVGL